jgi:integrase
MASFKQNQKGNWYFIIDVGSDGDRDQKTFSKDDKGKKFEHEHQARSYAEKIKEQVDKGRNFNSVKLKDYMTDYFRTIVKEQVSETTYPNQWRIAEQYIIPHLGHHYVDRINDDHLDKYYKKMIKNDESRSSLSIASMILNKFFSYCLKKRKITDNPMKLVSRPSYTPPEKVVWTPEQVDFFIGFTIKKKFRVLYVLAEATGMRRGEMLALQWTDIDFDNSRLTINKSLKYTVEKGTFVSFTKTQSSRRTITLPQYVIDALKSHRETQLVGALLVFDNFGDFYSLRMVSDHFLRDNKESGLPLSTLHGLRHAHATFLLSNGFSVADVAARLGDKKETIMMVYAHALPNTQNEIAAALDRRKNVDK